MDGCWRMRSCTSWGGQAGLHRVEAAVPAHPHGHLTVEGRCVLAAENGEGRLAFAVEHHVERKSVIAEAGVQLEAQRGVLDAAWRFGVQPEKVVLAADGPEEPRDESVGYLDAVPVVVDELPHLLRDIHKLGREFAPLRVVDDLFERYLVMDGGKARLVLTRPEEGDGQATRFGVEPEDEVMFTRFGVEGSGEEASEALPPLDARLRGFIGTGARVEGREHLEGCRRHMTADSRE